MIRSLGGKTPSIHPTAFISEAAYIVGDVEIGEGSSIWPGTVIRGDTGKITIGKFTNIQDNSVLHGDDDVIIGDIDIKEAIAETTFPHLDVIVSTNDLVGAEVELVNIMAREYQLKTALKKVIRKYDVIILDCPPSLGLLTINALTSSHAIIIPIQCEYYALEGLSQLLNTFRLVQRHLNKKLIIGGVLMTMYDSRLNLSKQVVQEVKSYFKDKLFKTLIYRNVKLSEAPSFGKPALLYDANSNGAKNYLSLTEEILPRVI